MRDILLVFLLTIGMGYAIKAPKYGVMLWSWLGYMNPHRLTYGFAYTLPVTQIAALAVLVGLLISKEKKSFPITPTTVVWIILLLHMLLTTALAVFPDEAWTYADKVYKIQLIIFITAIAIRDEKALEQLIWVVAFSIGFYGIKGGIFVFATAGGARVWGPQGTFIEGNNELSIALLMVIPLIFFLRQQLTKPIYRHLMAFAIVLCLASVVASYSRGAIVASLALIVFIIINRDNKAKNLIIFGFAILVAVALMPKEWTDRMNTIKTAETDQSFQGRTNAWAASWNHTLAHPFVGGGFTALVHKSYFALYAPNPAVFFDSHSIYFKMMGDHGFVGLFLFLLAAYLAWRDCKFVQRKLPQVPELLWHRQLAFALQAGMLAFGVGGMAVLVPYFDLIWHLLIFSVLLRKFAEQKAESLNLIKTKSFV